MICHTRNQWEHCEHVTIDRSSDQSKISQAALSRRQRECMHYETNHAQEFIHLLFATGRKCKVIIPSTTNKKLFVCQQQTLNLTLSVTLPDVCTIWAGHVLREYCQRLCCFSFFYQWVWHELQTIPIYLK